jgi:hypothetical protein
MSTTDAVGELFLERVHSRSGADPAGAEGGDDLLDLVVEQLRAAEDEIVLADGLQDRRNLRCRSL